VAEVAFRKLTAPSAAAVEAAVRGAVDRVAPAEDVVGDRVLVKLNAMSDEVFPGRNTSPWVVDAAIGLLRERYPRATMTIVDADTAGARQFERACANWGYDVLARRHGVRIQNLSDAPTRVVRTENVDVPELELPACVLDATSLINLPVIKTHVITGITCALKNHWGLLPRVRYQYHPIVNEVIAEVNRCVNTVLSIVDGTVCIEGPGPKTGIPRVANVILAGRDRVAVDSAVIAFMGLDPRIAPHVRRAAERGVGSTEFAIVGDAFEPQSFASPVQSGDLVSLLESRIRAIPIVGPLCYKPAIAHVLGKIGTQYNRLVWMNVVGRKHVAAMRRHPDYGAEFDRLGR
jgi:uncharacterized protein (DUF362 family)